MLTATILENEIKIPQLSQASEWGVLSTDNYWWRSWLQQLGKWSYNPMLKSATARQLYMTYILHIQDLIEDGLYIFTDLTIYIIWKIQVRYLDMMLVMITGGEYCDFHWKISSQVSQTRRTTNATRMFLWEPGWEPDPRHQLSKSNVITLISGSRWSYTHILDFKYK